ncbi:MAG: hypothetical protein U9R25_01685 [Chloroflexota bacterium]|nr:hypothetical protein [Chloroflexota bacterium]
MTGKQRDLWVLLAVALALRLVLMPLPDPYDADLTTFWAPWMQQGAEQGLAYLYSHGDPPVNYPPLYLSWLALAGLLYKSIAPAMPASPLQSFLIKLPAVLADLGIVFLLYRGARWVSGSNRLGFARAWLPVNSFPTFAFLVAALWALNPAVIYVSAFWGQVDSIHTFFLLAALMAALTRRWGMSGVLIVLGLLTKLQAVVLLPLLLYLAWRAGYRSLGRFAAGSLGTLATTLILFAGSNTLLPMMQVYGGSVGYFDKLTVNAYNTWWLVDVLGKRLFGEHFLDSYQVIGPLSLRWIGLLLMAGYAVLVLWRLDRTGWWLKNREEMDHELHVFFAAGMLVFGFFMLPTEIHERYILPALAFLAMIAWCQRGLLIAYLLLSFTVLINLLEVLPFAPWLYRSFASVEGERVLLAVINVVLFLWLNWRYLGTTPLARPGPTPMAGAETAGQA